MKAFILTIWLLVVFSTLTRAVKTNVLAFLSSATADLVLLVGYDRLPIEKINQCAGVWQFIEISVGYAPLYPVKYTIPEAIFQTLSSDEEVKALAFCVMALMELANNVNFFPSFARGDPLLLEEQALQRKFRFFAYLYVMSSFPYNHWLNQFTRKIAKSMKSESLALEVSMEILEPEQRRHFWAHMWQIMEPPIRRLSLHHLAQKAASTSNFQLNYALLTEENIPADKRFHIVAKEAVSNTNYIEILELVFQKAWRIPRSVGALTRTKLLQLLMSYTTQSSGTDKFFNDYVPKLSPDEFVDTLLNSLGLPCEQRTVQLLIVRDPLKQGEPLFSITHLFAMLLVKPYRPFICLTNWKAFVQFYTGTRVFSPFVKRRLPLNFGTRKELQDEIGSLAELHRLDAVDRTYLNFLYVWVQASDLIDDVHRQLLRLLMRKNVMK